ncbi:MAG: rRNA adenine N-6-methyltransferase family protein, partial [bacterium]|nr:rRNA adenine N-6-methyltransferase family protein [bacterium]
SSTIPPKAFFPPPKVDSAIINLAFAKTPGSKIPPPKWSHFLHRGFAHRRQMLYKSFPKEVLIKLQIEPTRRPQTLSLEEWHHLFAAQPEISSTKSQ